MRLPAREVIGVPECPILHRWTLLKVAGCKLLLHHFLPESRDRDPHDHPCSFVTLVLRGGYVDISSAGRDRLRAGSVRRRRAEHRHVTIAGPRGAWTLVVMGPKRRPWGFWREGRWWPWRRYEQWFGHGFRCEDVDWSAREVR